MSCQPGKRGENGMENELRKAEKERDDSIFKIKKTLEGAVSALAVISEKRDASTAGHQLRTAALAAMIAKELGFSAKETEGIRTAGTLHDIGKIYIPAEILGKPGKINEFEMALIKTHPEVGFEIIKAIPFEGPVAQIILQHHERLNGSGYPKGLVAEEILPEARILAVADVVEAMASHRPYRPSLGVEAAIEEVAANKGRLYDDAAVEALMRIYERCKSTLPMFSGSRYDIIDKNRSEPEVPYAAREFADWPDSRAARRQ